MYHSSRCPYITVIYRGCADQENLPLGVDTNEKCIYQSGSMWNFCYGALCNKGQIGKACGQKVAKPEMKIESKICSLLEIIIPLLKYEYVKVIR